MKWVIQLGLVLMLIVLARTGAAAESQGGPFPDTITLDGKSLKLNGSGVRTKTILRIKVYVAALYLETRSTSTTRILAADSARRLELRMTHESPRRRIVEELTDGFERSTQGKPGGHKPRLDKLLSAVSDLSEGQALTLSYMPGQGTTIQCGGSKPVTVSGKDFADVVFSIWLGADPLDEDLKRRLLGAS